MSNTGLSEVITHERRCIDIALAEHWHAHVIPADPSDKVRKIHNLGWLLRHRNELKHPREGIAFTVRDWRYVAGAHWIDRHTPVLLAHFTDGRTYATTFQDVTILHDWLMRPSFPHYLVAWDTRHPAVNPNKPTTVAIGGLDYKALEL